MRPRFETGRRPQQLAMLISLQHLKTVAVEPVTYQYFGAGIGRGIME
jgi:hypothetical protein